MEAIPSLAEKLSDCCSAVPLGHCGTINLPKGFAPIGNQAEPRSFGGPPPSSGGRPVTNSGIRVQIIAAGFFVQPNPDRQVLEPVVTIHNQGDNLMYVGRYTQFPTHESFVTHFRVPPGGSVTVTWWQLWDSWLGGTPPPVPGRAGTAFQLAVTGRKAKGCYVISWCCPIQAKVDVDVPVKVNVTVPKEPPEDNPTLPVDPRVGDATAPVVSKKT